MTFTEAVDRLSRLGFSMKDEVAPALGVKYPTLWAAKDGSRPTPRNWRPVFEQLVADRFDELSEFYQELCEDDDAWS